MNRALVDHDFIKLSYRCEMLQVQNDHLSEAVKKLSSLSMTPTPYQLTKDESVNLLLVLNRDLQKELDLANAETERLTKIQGGKGK